MYTSNVFFVSFNHKIPAHKCENHLDLSLHSYANSLRYPQLMTIMQRFILFLLLCAPVSLFAQSLKTYERAGDRAFESKDWNSAVFYYQTVLNQDKANKKVRYKYAQCAVEMYAYETAEKTLLGLKKVKGTSVTYPDMDYTMARTLQGLGRYALAATEYSKYISNADSRYRKEAMFALDQCNWAAMQSAQNEILVTNMGKPTNSAFSDFAPVMFRDTLYYSSYRFERKKDKTKPARKWTKVLFGTSSKKPKEATHIFGNQDSTHVAHTTFFPNGHYMVYTQCKDSASQIKCDLYISARDKNGRWLPGKILPQGINASGYTTTHPHIGQAKGGALSLYFASDRPGGIGNLDLYSVPLDTTWFCACKEFSAKKQFILPDMQVDRVRALRLFNTTANEATPYYQSSTNQLIWASEGRVGFGGYDLYRANMDGSGSENLGQPINGPYHDLYPFLMDSSLDSGLLASNRMGSAYLNTSNKACCFDLWQWKRAKPSATVPNTPKDTAQKIVVLPPTSPSVPQTGGVPPIVSRPNTVTPEQEIKQFVGLPLYFDNDEPDKRTRKQTTNKTYEQSVLAYLQQESLYKQKWMSGLKSDEKRAEAESEMTAFFEDEVRRGYDRLFELSEVILARLESGARVEVLVKGFTSPRAQTDYNLALGYRRISSIQNHFAKWQDGTLLSYLQSGKLLITRTSFGETTASALASDRLDDEINSIFNPTAARERRVEIIEIKTQ
jgi:tetratricopeptide (TPR) repeat protein